MTQRNKIYVFLLLLWVAFFAIFLSHLNIKGATLTTFVFFTKDEGYNFEYKYGFPTPWYSRYYAIPDDQLSSYEPKGQPKGKCGFFDSDCKRIPTPPSEFLIYKDISIPVLLGQGLLALLPPAFLLLAGKSWIYVKMKFSN